MLLLPNLPEGASQLSAGGENGAAGMLHEGGLTVTLQQRLGAYEPPPGGNEEGYDHGRSRADADFAAEQHQKQAKNEGNHGADVAVGVAHGGYRVHPHVGGDLREHGVVEHQAGGISHLGQNEHDQKRQPSAHAAHGGAAENAQKHTGHENGLFEPPMVGQRAADGTDDGHQQRGDGTGIAPVGQIQRLVQPAGSRQSVEINGNQSRNQQNERGIADVIENPAPLQCGEFDFFHFYHSLNFSRRPGRNPRPGVRRCACIRPAG